MDDSPGQSHDEGLLRAICEPYSLCRARRNSDLGHCDEASGYD
jgi:hypothetical protein